MAQCQAKERLYLTADKQKLVGEGDKSAATLYAAIGDYIPTEAHARFGLVDGMLKATAAEASKDEAAAKAAEEAAAKEAKAGEDKDAGPGEDKAKA